MIITTYEKTTKAMFYIRCYVALIIMKLLCAKVRYRNPIKYFGCYPQDSYPYKGQVTNMAYPIGFMTGNWFEINKVSGDYFDFKGSPRIGIIPFTLKQFPKQDWEWDFSNAT